MKPSLIFLPGMGCNERVFAHQVQHLSDIADTRVLTWDQQTSREEMLTTLTQSAPPQCDLVGHSMGGWVAIAAAALHPERIRTLTLMSTWVDFPPSLLDKLHAHLSPTSRPPNAIYQEMRQMLYAPRQRERSLLKTLYTLIHPSQQTILSQITALLSDPSNRSHLPRIRCPTLVVHGREDPFFSLEEHECIAKRIKGSSYCTVIEECGHILPVERPQAVTALLRLWLQHRDPNTGRSCSAQPA